MNNVIFFKVGFGQIVVIVAVVIIIMVLARIMRDKR